MVLPRKPCIFTMWEDESAYKVRRSHFLSFGPIFHANAHVVEDSVLNVVLQSANKTKEEILAALRAVAMTTKDYYEDAKLIPEDDELVVALVRDGCFLLEMLHIKVTDPHPLATVRTRFRTDPYIINTPILRHIFLDFFFIQNQIPMVVLNELHVLLGYESGLKGMPLEEMLNEYFCEYIIDTRLDKRRLVDALHFIDAARTKMMPGMTQMPVAGAQALPRTRFSEDQSAQYGEMISVLHSVVDLKDSGVKIVKGDSGRVEWTTGIGWSRVLKLPPILINRDSDFIFRNIVVFEQRFPEDVPMQPVSAYLRLLNDVLRTPDDARILSSKGTIINHLGADNNIIEFFTKLELGDTYGMDMLSDTRREINKYCESRGVTLWADLRRTYFRSPWAYCSFAAAIFLLILTIMQVVYAMIAYYHPP